MAEGTALDFIASKQEKKKQELMHTPVTPRDSVSASDYIFKKLGVGTANIAGAISGFGSGASRALGFDEHGDALEQQQEDLKAVAERWNAESGGTMSAVDGEDSLLNRFKRGDLEARDVSSYLSDLLLTQAPQLVAGAGSAKIGSAVLAPALKMIPKVAAIDGAASSLGALLGTTTFMTAQETGSIYGEQEDKNFGKALAYGFPAGVLESVSQLHGMKRSGLGGYIAKGMEQKGEKSLKHIGLDILKSSAEEGLTEGTQSILEHTGSHESDNPITALKDLSATEVLENTIAGVVMGGAMTGTGSVLKKTKQVAGRKLKPLADRAIEEIIEESGYKREEEVVSGVSETSILDEAETVDDAQASQEAAEKVNSINEGVGAAEAVIETDEAVREEVGEHTTRAADELGVDPVEMHSISSKIYSSVKTAAQFTAQMVARFGAGVKKHALKMYNYFKKKMGEDRGSFSIEKNNGKGIIDKYTNKEIVSVEFTGYKAEKEDLSKDIFATPGRDEWTVTYRDGETTKLSNEELDDVEEQDRYEYYVGLKANTETALKQHSKAGNTKEERKQSIISGLQEYGIDPQEVAGMKFNEIENLIDDKHLDSVIGQEIDGHNIIANNNIRAKSGADLYIARAGNTVAINRELAKQKYKDKAWANSRKQVDGSKSTPIDKDEFTTFKEFITFSIAHEVAHASIKKSPSESEGQYEDRINTAAFEKIGKQSPVEESQEENEYVAEELEDDWYLEEDSYVDQDMMDSLDDWYIDDTGSEAAGSIDEHGIYHEAETSWDNMSQEEKDEYKAELTAAVNSGEKKLGKVSDEEFRAIERYLVDKGISEDGRKALYEAHADQLEREDRDANYEEDVDFEERLKEGVAPQWTEGLAPEEMELDGGSTVVRTDKQKVVTGGKSFVAPEKSTPTQAGESEQEKISSWNMGGKYESIRTIDFYLDRKAKIIAQREADEMGLDEVPAITKEGSYYDETTIEQFENDNAQAIDQASKEFTQRSNEIQAERAKVQAKIDQISKRQDSPAKTKALTSAKAELSKLMKKLDLTELSDNDKREGRRSLADIILHDLQSAYPEAYIPSLIKFIKREEGIRSFAALSSYPDSLTELISHVKTKQDAGSDNLFQKEHDQSVKAQESFLKAVDALIDSRASEDISDVAQEVAEGLNVVYAFADPKHSTATMATVSVNKPVSKPTPDTRIRPTHKEKLEAEYVENLKLAKEAQAKRVELKKQEEENKERTHAAVMAQAKANQVMISMFPDFFEIVNDVLSAGKHQGIKNIRTKDISIKLTKKNKVFNEMSSEARENMVRRMILLVNGLQTSSFRSYSSRQELEGNPEGLHSRGAEAAESINHETTQLGVRIQDTYGDEIDYQLIDDFEEYTSSLNLINYTGSYIHFLSYVDNQGNTKYEDNVTYTRKRELIHLYGSVKETSPKINMETPFGTQEKGKLGAGITPAVINVREEGGGEEFTVSYRYFLTSWNLKAVGKPYNVKPGTRLALRWVASNDLEALVESIIERTDLITNEDASAYSVSKALSKAKTLKEAEQIIHDFVSTATEAEIDAFYGRMSEEKDASEESKEFNQAKNKISRSMDRVVVNHAHTQKYLVSFYKMVGRAYLTLTPRQLKDFYAGLHEGKIDQGLIDKISKKYFANEKLPNSETMHKLYKRVGMKGVESFHKYMRERVAEKKELQELQFYKFFAKMFVTKLADNSRAAYVMDTLDKSLLANPDLIKEIADSYKEFGVTEADITSAYVSLGGNKMAMANFISDRMQQHFYKVAQKALIGSPSMLEAKAHVLGRYDKKTQDLSKKHWGKDKSALDPKTRALLESIEYVVNSVGLTEETVRTPVEKKTETDAQAAQRQIEENKRSPEIASKKHAVGLDVHAEDIFIPKTELDPFEQSITDRNADLTLGSKLQVGTLASKFADFSYRSLAKLFGADLVIVNHSHGRKAGYKSRYIPQSVIDGKSKLVINVAQPVKFSSLFAHELFHHVVNKADHAQYKAFTEELAKLASATNHEGFRAFGKVYGKSNLTTEEEQSNAENAIRNEEIQAELYADVMFSKSFYEALSKTSAGKSIAAKLLKRLVGLISKIYGMFTSKEHRWSYEFDGMIDQKDMKKAIALMADLVAGSLDSNTLQRTEYSEGVRYWTPFGKKNKEEVEQIQKNKNKWIAGTWAKIFPKGTKNHKELMTGIEDLIVKTLKVMARIKPQGFIADWMSDKTAVKYAHWLQNYPAYHVTKARKQVINARKHVFNEFINEQTEKIQKAIEDGKYKHDGKRVDPKDKTLVREILGQLAENLKVQMHDDIVRDGLDFTKEADIKKAKDLGYNDEIIETFQAYKKVTDALYLELKAVFPSLKQNHSHYGQSIKWFHEGEVTIDESFERILTGNDRMFKGKDRERTTQQIAEDENLVYETIDPHEMFLNYVRDATRLMQFHKVVNAAIKSDHAKIFKNSKAATVEGYHPVVDSATRVIRELLSKGNPVEYVVRGKDNELIHRNGQPMAFATEEEANRFAEKHKGTDGDTAIVEEQVSSAKATIAYWKVSEETVEDHGSVVFNGEEIKNEDVSYSELKRFMTEQEAKDYAETLDVKTKVEAEFEVAKQDDVAQIYFSEDLAKLINLTLAEDKFRNGSLMGIQGKHALWVKNAMTSFEFALSGFHFITISIELIASYATWQQLRHKGARRFATGFNPIKAWRESREIAALVSTILTDTDYATDPAIIKRAGELLGVTDIEVLDVIKQYFTAGGLEQQDPDLRSRMNKGEMRYAEGPGDHVVVKNGKVEAVYGKLSAKAMMDSFKDVYQSELANHPNSPGLAKAKTALFIGTESATSWLMEGFIPKVKMATWVREYTLALEKNADKIERKEITKEEIGRQRMKFVEDRFGEVNWKNMWMDPSIKSFLQFFFRSFTWFTGGWKALGKAGIGLGKYGWFKVKGEEVEITQEGVWGLNVLLAHMMAVSFVALAYGLTAAGEGGEVPDDEDTPLLTRMLFPRIDPADPYARVSIPSYITEGYKLLAHLGLVNTDAEFKKLLSGRISSIITHTYEALYTGEDWRGVSIRNDDDNIAEQSIDTLVHMFGVLPISISSVKNQLDSKGANMTGIALSMIGMTEAPAAAKRSIAANLAFSYRRKEFKGKEMTPEEAELKDNVRKAAYLYGRGDKKPLNDMLRKKQISPQKYRNALKRIPYINGRKNPQYQSPLYVALSGLSIESAIKVWDEMEPHEKQVHKAQIIKKYKNTKSRGTKSDSLLKKIYKDMKAKGIVR